MASAPLSTTWPEKAAEGPAIYASVLWAAWLLLKQAARQGQGG